MNSRRLKIEATGDFAAGKIKPQIRLSGRWLEQAGFKPGHRVSVSQPKAGELLLQFHEAPPDPIG
jgi:type I toxin-antitoxin system toxin SymE